MTPNWGWVMLYYVYNIIICIKAKICLPDKDFKEDWGFKRCCLSYFEETQRNGQC